MEKKESTIFEYSFDFERYIKERIREINDFEERRFAKSLLLDGLGKSIQCLEEKFKALEQHIFEEVVIPDNRYEISCTIIEKSCFDPINDTLFPVSLLDFDKKELRRQLSGETEIYLETIYLELSEQELRLLGRNNMKISGCLKNGNRKEEVICVLHPVSRYRNMIKQLYQIFKDNDIKWNTVNTAFTDKFFDVFVKSETLDGVILEDDNLEPENLLGNREGAVRHDMLPLWNVQKILFESVSFMTPCSDGIHFEHEFILKEKTSQDNVQRDGYLIRKNDDITEIRHENDKILLCSTKSTFNNWEAYRITQEGPARSLGYTAPILTNRKKDSFFRRNAMKTRGNLMTKADLFRKITELSVEDYLEVIDYQICENEINCPFTEGMNWFIRENLFPMDSRKVLLFIFKEKVPDYYLNDAIVRFVISQIQMEINEYRCVGAIRQHVTSI